MLKQGASPVDKKEIEALAREKVPTKAISKRLGIDEGIVKLWTPEAIAKRAKVKAEAK